MRLVVLASGRGSNLGVILHNIREGRLAARVTRVVTDRPKAKALSLAKDYAVATEVIRPQDFDSRGDWNLAMHRCISKEAPDLVVCAGFMRVLGSKALAAAPGRFLNLHPSLLPAFPGAHAVRDALLAKVKISGCTFHWVDEGVDTGPILLQAAVAVRSGDDAPGLHARIQEQEHRLLPRLLMQLAAHLKSHQSLSDFAVPPTTGADSSALVSPA